MKKLLILILIIFTLGCAKHYELEKVNENHWKMTGSKGIEATIETKDCKTTFNSKKDVPMVEESSDGFMDSLGKLPIIG